MGLCKDISRDHSFLRTILPNSPGGFAKFRGSLRQNLPNATVHLGLPFTSTFNYIVLFDVQLLKVDVALSCCN